MKKNKGLRVILVSILILVLMITYLYVFFLPGVWHGNAFLYKKSDGIYMGSDLKHSFAMQRIPTEKGTDFSFTVDEKTEKYRVVHNAEEPYLQIYKNNTIVYEGTAVYNGHQYMLKGADNNLLEMGTSGVILITEESFPTRTQFVNWSLIEGNDIRGNIVIFYILIAAVVLLCLSYLLPRLLQASPHSGFANRAKRLRPILWGATVLLAALSFVIH